MVIVPAEIRRREITTSRSVAFRGEIRMEQFPRKEKGADRVN
jgi:hypothetical protein